MTSRQLYNTMQHSNENMTNYLVRFHNYQNSNDACNGSLITRGLQDHGMNILYPLPVTGFESLQNNDKKEAETAR